MIIEAELQCQKLKHDKELLQNKCNHIKDNSEAKSLQYGK